MTQAAAPRELVVIGGGMVAHRIVEALRARDGDGSWRVSVFAREPRLPYDRVALTSYFEAVDPEALSLGDRALWTDPLVHLHRSVAVVDIDRAARTVTDSLGRTHRYDRLVLATGADAVVPPVPGSELPGVFVYRSIDDVAALRGWVHDRQVGGRAVQGAVIGGGLLGLEAAGALARLGVGVTIVQSAGHLMNAQLDLGGGEALRRLINRSGIAVRVGTRTTRVVRGRSGRVGRVEFADGGRLPVELVVMATGVRPADALARAAGLAVHDTGGIVVDAGCVTSDPAVYAAGDVAAIDGRCLGLIAPGYAMAEIVVDRLLGGDGEFPGADTAAKLKLSGVDVASFGDALGTTPGALEVVWADPVAGVYQKLVMSDDARTLLGGVLVGDASGYASLRPMLGRALPGDPATYLSPAGASASASGELPDDVAVCSCNNVSAGAVRSAVADGGCSDLAAVKTCTRAGTSCGSCLPLVKKLVGAELEKSGVPMSTALCEHFAVSRAQLFDMVRVAGLRTFSAIIDRFGVRTGDGLDPGRGCDICKPVIASVLASQLGGHILDGEQATLQDTNDHVMANLQKDGSYSVVPRIAGGEVTPEGLIVIGEVARDFGLYTKITGGQRIDMFGARIEQLPLIWKRLVDAGFESGHAYGKSLRTVKSCVGSTWCRYGVQDSVEMAVRLELRYRGLRSPHKLKMGVSGCARECAEARGKDVGVIATDRGWNLYVGGNGGFTPRHAQLFAEDLDDEALIRTIDRFLQYYIRTADRLQRTAHWIQEVDGGMDAVRAVVLEDSLGICADLDTAMLGHVESYADEWAAVLADPDQLQRFSSFVNAPDEADPDLQYLPTRGQVRPATPDERRAAGPVLIAGVDLAMRR